MPERTLNKLVVALLSIQIVLALVFGLESLDFDLLFFPTIISLFYLVFVPGLLIILALNIKRLRIVEIILYSIGLSLSFLMFVGLLVNTIYPLLEIKYPLSKWPLIITILSLTFILGLFALIKDRRISIIDNISWRQLTSPPAILMLLLPVLSILGSQSVNSYQNNIVLLVMIALIAVISIIIIFTNVIHKELYFLVVAMIGLALLYHTSLISNYITGWDIHDEYYFASTVIKNNVWDSATAPDPYNAMLSVVMISPIYSIVSGLDLTWLYKIVYPIFYVLVPLGIFQICKKQADAKIALLASFVFMFVSPFYSDMISLPRQQIAELFLVITVLLIVSETGTPLQKYILVIISSLSIIVSHYSVSYIFLFSILAVILLLKGIQIVGFLIRKTSPTLSPDKVQPSGATRFLTYSYFILFFVVSISWYMWQSGSSILAAAVNLVAHVSNTFITEFLSPVSSQALRLVMMETGSPIHEFAKYLQLLIQLLIFIGLVDMLIKWRKKNFTDEFAAFAITYAFIMVAAAAVPYMASSIDTSRLYHIALIFLSPFFAMGIVVICRVFGRPAAMIGLKTSAVVMALFLLFNSGFIYEILQDHPTSISLSQSSILKSDDRKAKAFYFSNFTPSHDVYSARWLVDKSPVDRRIFSMYSDPVRIHALTSYGGIAPQQIIAINRKTEKLDSDSYVYLQYLNVVELIGTEMTGMDRATREVFSINDVSFLWEKAGMIYTNSGSQVLLTD